MQILRSEEEKDKKLINKVDDLNKKEEIPNTSIEKEKFFFVGHKSGHSNLVQILISQEENLQKTTNDVNELSQKNKISKTSIESENVPFSPKIETKKPLEQVNISDLLALHKKS